MHREPRHTCAASLHAAILAAAEIAPAENEGRLFDRSLADDETIAHDYLGGGVRYVHVHGPCRPMDHKIAFCWALAGARGQFVVHNNRARLLALADIVRKQWALFGGGAKPADMIRAPRQRIAWPAVLVKVWREQCETGEWADALRIGLDKLGGRVYIGSVPFLLVAPCPVDGLPENFASARRCDGKWVVFDTVSGCAIGSSGSSSRRAAEELALNEWCRRTDEQLAAALRSARELHTTSAADAMAAWCKAHGLDDANDPGAHELASEPAVPGWLPSGVGLLSAHECAGFDATRVDAPAPGPAPYPGNATDAPSGQVPAGDALAADVADWLAKTWPHLADDPRPRAGLILAAQSERQRAARIHGRYAEIADACTKHLQARADALPVPPTPTREHLPFDGFGGAWCEIRNGRAAPDEYRAHVIEAMQGAKASGLFYNTETYPRAAAIMAARWGYPDLREAADCDDDGVPRDFGSHCYMAHDAIRAREAREAQREAREALRLAPGVKLGALVFSDGKLTRAMEVADVSGDGEMITVTGNRGTAAVRGEMSPMAVRQALERAHERGKRRDTYAEFCAGRPPAPAQPEQATTYPGNQTKHDVGEILVEPAAPDHAAVAAADAAACQDDALGRVYGDSTDAARLADLHAANETAAALVGAIDAAATGADAVGLLRAEAARVRMAAHGLPDPLAARYRLASAMLDDLAQCRAADLADAASIAPPANWHEARGMRMQRDALAGQLRTGAMTLPGLVLVMLRDKVVALSAAMASVQADWCATNAEMCAGLAPIKPARILRAAPTLRPGAWLGAPVAAGGTGAIGRAGPTCYPWRAAGGAWQLARPPPAR